ncbi:hypothetical protein ACHQM5_012167 [Ranunculus cassubicifolius]
MVDVSDETIELPPGFRFHPTDEEIITHYLSVKVMNSSFSARAIGEADLNKCEPWDLPKKARMGEKEWYFFCQRDRKYPTGMRTNRATEAGYWKATGKDKEIFKGRNCLVGMKKTLVFYRGRAPKGEKTNWVMHEYRLDGKFSYHNIPKTAKDEWVVCRVFHKSSGIKKTPMASGVLGLNSSFGDEPFDSPSLPPLLDSPYINNNTNQLPYSTNLGGGGENFNINSSRQLDNKNFISSNTYTTLPPNNNYYPQVPFPNHLFAFQGPSQSSYMNNPDFQNHQAILRALAGNNASYDTNRQCKVEQFSSNQSIVSQDTGLSTDITTEISSVPSKHDMGGNRGYEEFEGPSSSAGGVADLENLWDY